MQYVRALKEAKPKYFIYENNKSMSNAIKESISDEFGFEPICINSALLSAQSRQRLYWVGRRNEDNTYSKVDVKIPEDKGIILKDVLENGIADKDKSYCLKHQAGNARDYFKKHHTQIKFEPVNISVELKSQTIKAQYHKTSIANICGYTTAYGATGVAEPVNPLKSGKGRCVTSNYCNKSYKHILESNFSENSSKQTWDSVAEPLNAYAIPVEFENDIPVKAISQFDGKTYLVYKVENGSITVKDKQYPIKLEDGYYIIRKLSVRECARLQTIPDWYVFPVSDTQAYKMIGNGWTIDVISWLLEHTKER